MENTPSPIETLRQLREMLDAGTITNAEFEALKQKLVFPSASPATPVAGSIISDLPKPAAPATEELPVPAFEAVPVAALPDDYSAFSNNANPATAETLPTYAEAAYTSSPAQFNESESVSGPPARNPLNLILAIVGVLAFLSLVLYLSLNNRSSEHISSTSQTAADSLNTAIEEGPQAEQIELAPAVPDTVRIAPANPAPPVVRPSATPIAPDSTKPMVPATVADSAKKQ